MFCWTASRLFLSVQSPLASTGWAWSCWSLTTWWSFCSTRHASSTSATRTSRRGIDSVRFCILGVICLALPDRFCRLSLSFSPFFVQFYSVGSALRHRPAPHPHPLCPDVQLWAAPYRKSGLFSLRRQLQRAHCEVGPSQSHRSSSE